MHVGGGKVTSSHGTFIEAAEPVVAFANRSDSGVKRIRLGFINRNLSPTTPHRIKMQNLGSAISLKIRGTTSTQTIFLYADDLVRLERELQQELGHRFVITRQSVAH